MANQHTYEEKGKVQPKPEHEGELPQKVEGPVTVSDMEGKLNAETLTRMQQTVGNAAVQRFLAQRSGEGSNVVDDETASTINAKRGGGQALDDGISSKAGEAMGHDFSGVNVHTDSQSDELNQQLGAKAFTTGSDIFFKEGAYNPSSNDGQQLISHELTHVVQQSSNTTPGQGKMTVNDPNDQYESQADAVAESVLNLPEDDSVQRETSELLQTQIEEEEPEMAEVQTQEEEEGEEIASLKEADESLQAKLQMEEMPEEEEALAAKLQMEEMLEEEESLAAKLQMEEMPEEEEALAAKLQRQVEEEESIQPRLQMQEEIPEEEL